MKLFYCLVVYNFIDTHYFLIRKLFMKNFEIYWTEKVKYCVEILEKILMNLNVL